MKKKLIIFDFDDTLTDNSERDLRSFLDIIEAFDLKFVEKQEILNWRKEDKTSEFIIKQLNNIKIKDILN